MVCETACLLVCSTLAEHPNQHDDSCEPSQHKLVVLVARLQCNMAQNMTWFLSCACPFLSCLVLLYKRAFTVVGRPGSAHNEETAVPLQYLLRSPLVHVLPLREGRALWCAIFPFLLKRTAHRPKRLDINKLVIFWPRAETRHIVDFIPPPPFFLSTMLRRPPLPAALLAGKRRGKGEEREKEEEEE